MPRLALLMALIKVNRRFFVKNLMFVTKDLINMNEVAEKTMTLGDRFPYKYSTTEPPFRIAKKDETKIVIKLQIKNIMADIVIFVFDNDILPKIKPSIR